MRRHYKFGLDLPEVLALKPDQVGALTRPQRERRVEDLIELAGWIFGQAVEIAENHQGPREVVAVAGMFSGGNDSTTAVHVMRPYLTHLIHADTGTGLEVTRQFVKETAGNLGLPLISRRSPKEEDRYETLVLERGFPGPGMHQKFYQRLKEHAWQQARRELVSNGRRERVIYMAGRRRNESKRRANVPELERDDSIVWVSPMVLWTKLDLNTYRLMRQVPVNPVYEMLHMSGECLCGCYAQQGEREWLYGWFDEDPAVHRLQHLEKQLEGRTDIPEQRRQWGCGGQNKKCLTGICNE